MALNVGKYTGLISGDNDTKQCDVRDIEHLTHFLDHLEKRVDILSGTVGEQTHASDEHNDVKNANRHEFDEGVTSAGTESSQAETKDMGKASRMSPPDHPMVARLRGVMNDDGRRRRVGENADLEGIGFHGLLGGEYFNLFEHLADAQFMKSSVRLQSWWRTMRSRMRLNRWKATRIRRKCVHFRAWKSATNAQTYFDRMICKWVWRGWRQVVLDQKSIRKVSWQVFKSRVGRKTLSITAVNLFFSEDADPPDASSYNALRLGVRRQILQLLIDSWRQELKYWRKCRIGAMIMMQRAFRRTEAGRPRWTPELVSLVFHMWRRSLAYKRRFKAKERLPKFSSPDIPEWDEWVHRYTSRQLLKQKVSKRGTRVFKRERLRRWLGYTRYMRGIADRLALAKQHFEKVLLLTIMGSWLKYCRSRGRFLRRRGIYFGAWRAWAPRKRRLRQLKRLLSMKANMTVARRGMQRWSLCMNNVRLLYAFQQRRITDKSAFYPAMSAAFAFCGLNAHFVMLSCFRNWQLLRTRRIMWHGFYYLHQRNMAIHLLSTVFHAWQHILSKWRSGQDSVSFEPALILDRGRATIKRLHEGLRPELSLPRASVERLLPMVSQDPAEIKPKPRLTDLERKLVEAINKCDEKSIETLLVQGARVDVVDERGRTPLHHACSYFNERYLKVIAMLLHCGADIQCKDHNGERVIDIVTNVQAAALLHTHSLRVANKLTPSELTDCMQLMTLEWRELGGIALWRFVVSEFLSLKHRELESTLDILHMNSKGAVTVEINVAASSSTSSPVPVAELMGRKRLDRINKVLTFLHKSQKKPSGGEVSKVGDYSGSTRSVEDSENANSSKSRQMSRTISLDTAHDDDENDEDPMLVRRRHVSNAPSQHLMFSFTTNVYFSLSK